MSDAHQEAVHKPTPLLFSSLFGWLCGEIQGQLSMENLEAEDGANRRVTLLRRMQCYHLGCRHIAAYGAIRTENDPDVINSSSDAPRGNSVSSEGCATAKQY